MREGSVGLNEGKESFTQAIEQQPIAKAEHDGQKTGGSAVGELY